MLPVMVQHRCLESVAYLGQARWDTDFRVVATPKPIVDACSVSAPMQVEPVDAEVLTGSLASAQA